MSELRETKICRYCGRPYERNPKWSRAYFATREACSRECRQSHQPDILTDYVVTDAGCWEWQGRMDANGYGKSYDPSRQVGQRVDWAHRVSYRKHRGEIPEGYELDHECCNTRCINPDHLTPRTRADHIRVTFERAGGPERMKSAAYLRRLGLTYKEIANALGLMSRTGAKGRVDEAIRRGLVDADSLPQSRVPVSTAERYDIAYLYEMGIPQTEIAAWYGLDSSHVSRIVSWAQDNSRSAA